jgi:hypothetical protein
MSFFSNTCDTLHPLLDSYSYYGSVIFHICCIYRCVASESVVVLELFSVETLTAVYFCNVTLQRQGLLRVLFVLELKVAASSLLHFDELTI